MNLLLKTTTGVAALLAGAGIAMAEGQSAATTTMGTDVTCADIVNLQEDEAERTLYFLAGLEHGQKSSAMTHDSAAAMQNNDSTDPDVTTDTAATNAPGNQTQGNQTQDSASSVGSSTAPLPNDNTAAVTPPVDGSAGADADTDTAASNVPSDQMGGSQTDGASQDLASDPAIESQDGSSETAADTSGADTAVDPTVTAGVSDNASGQFSADGFYQIPVEMVMTDCRSTPDASVTDILNQHGTR